jgi:hypothetical protein
LGSSRSWGIFGLDVDPDSDPDSDLELIAAIVSLLLLVDERGVVGFVLGFCTHGFSFGMLGVVYGDSAVRDRSHFFGAQMPMRRRQAAIKRLALS